jgi:DNA-binding response OmpR family regulator
MATEQPMTSFDDGTLHIDFVRQQVTIHGHPVNLKPPEYRLLTTMVLHQGEVFSPDRLTELFGADSSPQDVAYTVMCLRSKLGQKGYGSLIGTVRGFGYICRSSNR